MRDMDRPAGRLLSAGFTVMRSALVANLLWIGALKFKRYEVENIEPLVTSSPLLSSLRQRLGAENLARLIGVTEITIGSLIAAKPLAPKASATGSFAAVGMFLSTLSFFVTTPGARQEGGGALSPSLVGQFLVKDSVLLGAALVTAADALRAGQPR